MKKLFTLLFVSFCTLNVFSQSIIARWNFEVLDFSTTAGTTFSPTAGSVVADSGALVTGSAFSALHASGSSVWSTPSGNGSANAASSNNWAAGDYWQVQASTTGYTGIYLTFDATGSSTGPKSFKVQYSTDGTSFTDVPNTITNATYNLGGESWSASTYNAASTRGLDLTSITSLNNAPFVYFRFTLVTGSTSINGGTIATTGTSRIDNIIISDMQIAPLNLTSFNAALLNNNINLSWTTSNELNVSGFSIEKSNDGFNYNTLQFINAKNGVSNSYSFVDNTVVNGVNYYRLKMIDKDGSYKYSKIVALSSKKSPKLEVFPNPVASNLTVSHEKAMGNAVIKIATVDGKVVMTRNLQEGATQSTIDVSKLLKGNYLVLVVNDGTSSSTQFIKQ